MATDLVDLESQWPSQKALSDGEACHWARSAGVCTRGQDCREGIPEDALPILRPLKGLQVKVCFIDGVFATTKAEGRVRSAGEPAGSRHRCSDGHPSRPLSGAILAVPKVHPSLRQPLFSKFASR